MSSNFVRFQEIINQAFAENFICLTQRLANLLQKSISLFPNRDPLFEAFLDYINFMQVWIPNLQSFVCSLQKRLERQGVSDVSKQVNEMVEKILKFPLSSPEHIDDLSVLVQDNYQTFQRRLETAQFYKNLTDDDRDRIIDLTEKYITVRYVKNQVTKILALVQFSGLSLIFVILSIQWTLKTRINGSTNLHLTTLKS